jgi:glutamate racemase
VGRIGVIGTRATIRSGAYEQAIRQAAPGVEVVSQACPLFVPIVEEGWADTPVARSIAEQYLEPLMRAKVDAVILGCTHYPLLVSTLAPVLGEGVVLIDPAEIAAGQVAEMLAGGSPAASSGPARHTFFLSDVPASFEEVGRRFLGRDLGPVERIEQTDLPWFER